MRLVTRGISDTILLDNLGLLIKTIGYRLIFSRAYCMAVISWIVETVSSGLYIDCFSNSKNDLRSRMLNTPFYQSKINYIII